METASVKILWIAIGSSGSLVVGVLLSIFRNALAKNATKETVEAKADLLEKDIGHINKELTTHEKKIDALDKKITELREDSKDLYVSKELFHETIKQFNEKLDTILKFVKK